MGARNLAPQEAKFWLFFGNKRTVAKTRLLLQRSRASRAKSGDAWRNANAWCMAAGADADAAHVDAGATDGATSKLRWSLQTCWLEDGGFDCNCWLSCVNTSAMTQPPRARERERERERERDDARNYGRNGRAALQNDELRGGRPWANFSRKSSIAPQ